MSAVEGLLFLSIGLDGSL